MSARLLLLALLLSTAAAQRGGWVGRRAALDSSSDNESGPDPASVLDAPTAIVVDGTSSKDGLEPAVTGPGGTQSLGGRGDGTTPLVQPVTPSIGLEDPFMSPVLAPTATLLPAPSSSETCPAGQQLCANAGACKDTQSDAEFCGPSCTRCACGKKSACCKLERSTTAQLLSGMPASFLYCTSTPCSPLCRHLRFER